MRLPAGEPAFGPWRAQPLAALAARLAGDGAPAGRAHVIAVDGRSASGKTTLAARLAASLPRAAVVHTDDVAWHHGFFSWAELLATGVLEPVHRGEPVAFRPPPWDERGRPGAVAVPAGTAVVIVEGVGAGRRALSHLLDALVWVQSDAVLARERGIARDGGDVAFWDEWEAEEVPFLAADRPWERADAIAAGTQVLAHDPATEVVTARRNGRPHPEAPA